MNEHKSGRIAPAEIMEKSTAIRDWLGGEARFIKDPDVGTAEFARRLVAAGIPLDRMMTAIPTLYSARRGLGRLWTTEGGVRELEFPWDNEQAYVDSPFHAAHETREWVELRLDEVGDDRYDIVSELRAEGVTHYICVPVFFRDGAEGGITYATKSADGFSETDLAILRAIESAIGLILEVNRTWRIIRETLTMYVGAEPQKQILSGQVRLGEVMRMRSAIVFADMRGFTALTSQMTAEQAVALLNRYFDCVVPPIEDSGGQILKYIGDGVLAIYRADADEHAACAAALEASDAILGRVNGDRAKAPDEERFDIKLALHFGEVAYGNIGSGTRLDYTVVGRDVNIASRLTDLAGRLERRVLISREFAEMLPSLDFHPAGEHMLRGVSEPQSVFEPAF